MKISLFANVSECKNPEILDLIEYLFDTRDGKWEIDVGLVRNKKTKEERDELKRKLPTACLSGQFSYRSDSNLVTHSEIIAMDLDEVENVKTIKAQLSKDKFVFACFLSTSGMGLRVLFKIEPNKHRDAFKGLCQYIFEKYGEPCDTNSSVSKPYVVSYDPELYLNPDYESCPVFKKYIKETVVKNIPSYIHNEDDFKQVYNQILGRRVNICESYDDYLKIGFALAEEYGEGGRAYFHELSQISEKYRFSTVDKQYTYCLRSKNTNRANLSSFYYLAKANGINIVTERTKEIIRVTKNSKKAGLSKEQITKNLREKAKIDGVDKLIEKIYESNEKDDFEEEDSMLSTLELFISNQYSLRYNEVTGFFDDNGRIIQEREMNSIFIAAKKIIPKLDFRLMIRLLKSDFTECYNPFFEFWKSDGIPYYLPANPDKDIKKFESPLIDKLASCIKNEDPAFTLYFLRKWLVSIVSSAHKVHSPLLFCLLGAQHTGKTEFFRRLMPKELQDYYAESKLDKGNDDEILMTQNLMIMDDELGGKSKADALKLKNITSKQYFSLRRPYGEHNEKLLRLAVLCGTSNYKAILSDPTGNRRIIPVEVQDIDKEKYNSIDKKELFMEMFKLYKEGFDWRVLPSDLKMLNQDEEKYSVVIKERELIMRYYAPGDNERMSTTDILVEIERMTGQRLNLTLLGTEMEELGFVKKSTRHGSYNERVTKMWCIEKIGRSEPLPVAGKEGTLYNPSNEKGEPKDDLPF